MTDPETRALMQRIDLSVDPALDAAFPGQRAARVTLVMRDGRELSHLQPTRKGDPEAPLTDADLDDKFLELVAPVIGDRAAQALLARLWSLDSQAELRELMAPAPSRLNAA
jgi:2-methylcitrate dehydratase PrpD